MTWTPKYQALTRDRHNILWTSIIHEQGSGGEFNIIYGLLYNYYAAIDARNIANTGWHLPTKTEFETLVTYLQGSELAGGKLKETGYTHWNSPNTGATNETGFNARGEGMRNHDYGAFHYQKLSLDLWSSTLESGSPVVFELHENLESSLIFATYQKAGLSIRLIKDDDTDPGSYIGNDGNQYGTVKIGNQVWMASSLCETLYRDLTAIPEVTDNTAWAALTTGALCAYNNNWDNVSSIISVADLIGAGPQPLKFEFCNESDDPFDPIKSSRAIISVWAYSMFAFDDLYSQSEMANYVEIKQSANLWWKGYVDPHQCQEQYGPVPYQADIYCIDGLTLLQKIPYEESEGIPYNGRKLESQIILDILSKIGLTEFKEYVNVYEVDMNAGIDDSPMDQLLIDVDVFEDMYCDEVLKEILTKYKACIRQIDGIFCIYRPRELTNITVYGRHFTSAITKTAVTLTPKQYIKRPDYSSSLLEVKSGSKMLQDPAKKVIITQDYGNKDSWLDNYQFKSNTYSGFPWKFDYWELEESAYVIPVSNYIPGETEGCMFANQNPWGEHVKCIYQKFGTNAVVTTDDFGFSFEYMYYNTGITPVEQVYFTIEIKNTIGTRWLRAKLMGTTWVDDMTWETEQHYIIAVQDSPPGKTDWFTFERKIPGLPVNGDFKISIFAPEPHSPMILTAIKNIKFYTTGLEISQKAEMRIVPYQRKRFLGIFYSKMREKEIYYFPFEPVTIIEREYTSENPGNKGLDLEYKSLLGDVTDTNVDNVLEQFAGALAKATPQVRVDKITLTGNSGQCLLTCDGIGRYAVWDNSLTHTAEEFVTAYEGLWLTDGITLTSSGEDVIFTSVTAGDEFFGETKVSYQSGTLDGIVEYNTPAFGLTPTLAWNTREGRENKPLLQIMADEMASQFSRYKQFLDLPLLETIKIESVLNLLGNFQDAINLRNGYLRVFIANRGTFDVKLRKWQLDLIEMGEAEAIAEGESLTADTVLITADTVEITADQTHK